MNGLSPTSTGGPSERSGSVASTASTASSYTSPQIGQFLMIFHVYCAIDTNLYSISVDDSTNPSMLIESSPSGKQNRSALLDSICSFNKASLNKIKKS